MNFWGYFYSLDSWSYIAYECWYGINVSVALQYKWQICWFVPNLWWSSWRISYFDVYRQLEMFLFWLVMVFLWRRWKKSSWTVLEYNTSLFYSNSIVCGWRISSWNGKETTRSYCRFNESSEQDGCCEYRLDEGSCEAFRRTNWTWKSKRFYDLN